MDNLSSFKNMVVDLETSGASFYLNMREHVQDNTLKELFSFMAEEEHDHAREFEVLCSTSMYNRYLGEVFARTREHLPHFFEKTDTPDTVAEKLDSEEAILNYALGMEKKSIELYTELLRRLANPELVNLVKKILEQEIDHYKNISAFLNIQKRSESDPIKNIDEMEGRLRESVARDELLKNKNKEGGNEDG